MTAAVQLLEDGELKTGWPLVSFGDLIGYSVLVIISTRFLIIFTHDYVVPYLDWLNCTFIHPSQ